MTNKVGVIGILIGVAILIAVFYLFLTPHEVGVLVSCNNRQIIDIRNVPPPLMAIYQQEFCSVNITVSYQNGTFICKNSAGVFASERGVIECNNLKNLKGNQVNINAIFFDLNNTQIGTDTKTLGVNP